MIDTSSIVLDPEYILSLIHISLKGLKNNGSGLVNECIDLAIDKLLSDEVGDIASKLYEMYTAARNGNSIEIINGILYGKDNNGGLIGDLKVNITEAIGSKISAYGDKFKSSLEQKITEGGNQAKEKIKDEISSFTAGIAGDSAGSSGSAAAASGLTMNYKEYVLSLIHI